MVAALLQLHDDVNKTGDIASLSPAQGLVVFCQKPPTHTSTQLPACQPTHIRLITPTKIYLNISTVCLASPLSVLITGLQF